MSTPSTKSPRKIAAREALTKKRKQREESEGEKAQVVTIGPPKLTRFERARIVGARSLQLALGAPPFIPVTSEVKDPISLAITELESRALPISIRRALPDGRYEDIPIDWLL